MYKNTQGIVIRTANYKDYDKMVTLLTREYGRVDALFRGCRKQSSPLLASSGEFVCADYSFYKKGDRFIAVQGSVLRSFFDVTKDATAFSLAGCLCDVCAKVSMPAQPAHRLYALLAGALYSLCEGAKPEDVFGFFVLKLMDFMGIRPVLDFCVLCENPHVSGINFSAGGAVCDACTGIRVNPEHITNMAKVYTTPSKNMQTWKNPQSVDFFADWLAHVLGEYPKSLKIFISFA